MAAKTVEIYLEKKKKPDILMPLQNLDLPTFSEYEVTACECENVVRIYTIKHRANLSIFQPYPTGLKLVTNTQIILNCLMTLNEFTSSWINYRAAESVEKDQTARTCSLIFVCTSRKINSSLPTPEQGLMDTLKHGINLPDVFFI